MKKQKKSRRELSEYPALNQKMNLPSRKEFIEVGYVNGVCDAEGKQVIRPLNKEEKQFLNQFYEETVSTNFLHDPKLRQLSLSKKKIIEDDDVIKLKNEVKLIDPKDKKEVNRLHKIIKLLKMQNEEKYEKKLRNIEAMIRERSEEVLLYPNKEDQRALYRDNNSRNTCLFNKLNTSQEIRYFDVEEYEKISQNDLDSIDMEDYIIDQIDKGHEVLEEPDTGNLKYLDSSTGYRCNKRK